MLGMVAAIAAAVLLLGAPCAAWAGCAAPPQARLAATLSPRWNLISVPVGIDGADARWLVDTGAELTMVTPGFAARLGLAALTGPGRLIQGIGGTTRLPMVRARTLVLDRLVLRDRVLTVGALPLSEMDGLPIQGVLGADLLALFNLDLDVPHRAMALYPPCAAAPFAADAVLPARQTRGGWLFVPVDVDGSPIEALLDTGFSGTTITARAAHDVGVADADLAGDVVIGAMRGVDLAAIASRRHRFRRVQIGSETMASPTLLVASIQARGIAMLLGMDYMQSHRLFLSYATGQVAVARHQ